MDNKLGLIDLLELDKMEEKSAKPRAKELFEKQFRTIKQLAPMRLWPLFSFLLKKFMTSAKFPTAGQRECLRFAPVMYLAASFENIDRLPQQTFEQIVEKNLS